MLNLFINQFIQQLYYHMSTRNSIYVLLISFVSLLPQVAYTQELTPVMEEFKSVCIQTRDAIINKDGQSLQGCRADIYNFYQKDIGNLNMISTDTPQKEMPDSLLHAIFDVEYIDSLLVNDIDLSVITYVRHTSNRGEGDPPKSGCFVCHKGITAGSTMKYKITGCSKNMRLVVVVAEKKDVNLTVTSKMSESGDLPVEQKVICSDGVLKHTWKMPSYSSDLVLTFENTNKNDVTCVIALQ